MLQSEVGEIIRRNALSVLVATLGLAAGIIAVTILRGTGRSVIIATAVVSLFPLVARIWNHYYLERIDGLNHEVETLKSQLNVTHSGHQRYLEAIDRIVDQEGPAYAEYLELTVVVGEDDESDSVVERRRTAPMPRITNRAIRPITPTDSHVRAALQDLDVRCVVEQPAGSVKALPLAEDRFPRLWLIFEPGMTEPFTWEISYRPRALWRPLRERRFDHLTWTDRLPAEAGGNSTLTGLEVTFMFPASAGLPHVRERHSHGEMDEPKLSGDRGQWRVTWRDTAPAGRRYEWDIAQVPGDDAGRLRG